jgi:competence ComEA-like helix-hairpin-helix protein
MSLARIGLVAATLCVVTLGVAAKKKPPAAPVNLNTATSEELQLVPGIGPATADKILQMRKAYGAFKSVDDLLAIRGIGPKRLEKMRKYLTVGKAAAAKPNGGAKTATPASAVKGGTGTPTAGAGATKPPATLKPSTAADDPPCLSL